MGLEKLWPIGEWPAKIAQAVKDQSEITRRNTVKTAVSLFRCDVAKVMEDLVMKIFEDDTTRKDFLQFIKMLGSGNLLRWISEVIGRPLYAPVPTRRVYSKGNSKSRKRDRAPEGEQAKYNDLCKALGLNGLMSLIALLLRGCGSTFLTGRIVDDKVQLDLVTGECVTIIADPDVPTKALAGVFDNANGWTVMDDIRIFQISKRDYSISGIFDHNLGRLPFVEAHPRGRWGHYWPTFDSAPLVSATIKCLLIDLLILNKHKYQSHLQLAATGDVGKAPKPQALGEAHVLMFEGAAAVQVLDLQASPEQLLKTKDATRLETAAMYGISAARLNQEKDGQDEPLNELTRELLAIMGEVEADTFDLVCKLSKATDSAMADGLSMTVDYRPQTSRMSPQEELDYYDALEQRGYRSPVDTVMALNPEIEDEEDALEEIKNNAMERQIVNNINKGTNTPADANVDNPGQTPQANGAMGPLVRDNQMSKDTAAALAANELPDQREPQQFAVGDRVSVAPGYEHMPEHKGIAGTIVIARGDTYGIEFDGIDGVHKWYTGEELVSAE